MSKLQIILIAVFSIVALIAVLMFAGLIPGFKGGGGQITGAAVTMWGIFPQQQMTQLVQTLNENNKALFQLSYKEQKLVDYRDTLLNAMASGNGPDIWMMTQDIIISDKSKVYLIPFQSINERDFKDTFIDEGELFFNYQKDVSNNTTKSIIGLPLAIDPIVLFWNKDIFSSNGVSQPPKTWDEFMTDVQTFTQKDEAGNIITAGTAMGKFSNIKNAKYILSMLILQGGNEIIEPDTMDVVLGEKGNNLIDPAESALRFFNEFSNPNKISYTWNEALPSSETMFSNGSLAMYFGFASEMDTIKQKNPHLNFDITEVPQIKDSKNKTTFGKIYGLVISKSSKNLQASFSAIAAMANADFERQFSNAFNLGPARRDILAEKATSPFLSVVYKSSIMSKAWLEPDPAQVSAIFKNMVESTASGRTNFSDAISNAKRQIEQLLR